MSLILWLIAASMTTAVPARATQKPDSIRGEILRMGSQIPERLDGVRVVLHRISPSKQGPVDSMVTAAGGRFRFRFVRDTAALYLVSGRFAGIEYFSDAITQSTGEEVRLMVFDTSSSSVTRTKNRTLVIQSPDERGVRQVLDWLVIENSGHLTRVGRDSLDPTWSAPLPFSVERPGLSEMQVSPFAAEAVIFRRDSVVVTAPLSPGSKELWLQYRIPADAGSLVLAGAKGDSIDVFVEEEGVSVKGGKWDADTMTVTGRRLHRYAGRGEGRVVVAFPRGDDSRVVLQFAVASFTIFLALATWYLLRRPPHSLARSRKQA